MHFKLLQSAEPLKAEALLLRGEDVSAANPRERFSLFAVARGLSISLLAGAPTCLRA
ncbi:hypothetical protein CGSMWGv00703Bmash_00040 [Gardnerella pickettii 00703Bmash]|nr:hypothetical protein CGSMWGv00703Bmash_00040 [Gardnerella pickettii 00703Bmash]EIK85125.1 hypothetical protein CGSMWGv00703C2mash_03965 [Gardnerella pickettii 00703C2mash]